MKYYTTNSNIEFELPIFIPVYRPDYDFELFCDEYKKSGLNAVMINSFLLYKDREKKKLF